MSPSPKFLVLSLALLFVASRAHADCNTYSQNRLDPAAPQLAFRGPDAIRQCEDNIFTLPQECELNASPDCNFHPHPQPRPPYPQPPHPLPPRPQPGPGHGPVPPGPHSAE
jgi:hypothetical protein